tara:strand:- start:88 stop:474 length:387 start_codon:yes stop_codon:yes gene_type:complete
MDEKKFRTIWELLIQDHNLDEFLKYCTDDIKLILYPKHAAAGIYDRKSIYNLFEHLSKSFPGWKELIEKVYHDKNNKVFISIAKGNSSTIKDIWDIHMVHYDKNDKIYKVEGRVDTLHLAEGNVGPRI